MFLLRFLLLATEIYTIDENNKTKNCEIGNTDWYRAVVVNCRVTVFAETDDSRELSFDSLRQLWCVSTTNTLASQYDVSLDEKESNLFQRGKTISERQSCRRGKEMIEIMTIKIKEHSLAQRGTLKQ